MSSTPERRIDAVEQVESILGGQPAASVPASCDAVADDLPEFLQAIDKQVVYGAKC